MKLAAQRVNRLALLSFAGLAIACGSASAQSTWINPVDGNWSDGTKWSAGVPNGIAAIINQPGVYNIAFNGNYSIPSLTQSVPGVTITIQDNLTYSMSGGMSNDGTLGVNTGAGANASYIRLVNGSQTIGGSGLIRLNSNGNVNTAQLTTNSGNWTLTQTAGHSVRGDGAIYVPMTNAGLISADVSGRTILVQNGTTTNNGTMRAENGAVLQINSVNVVGTGQIHANNATINMAGSGFTTQTLTSSGSGVINIQNSTFSAVTSAAQVSVLDNNNLNLAAAGMVNNGSIEVNNGAGANGTFVRLTGGSATLSGSGVLRLRSSGNLDTAQVTTNSGNWTLTHDVNHTIRGDGRIYTPINNLGSIIGDTPGRNLEILNTGAGNSGLISAENGGNFRLGSSTITQSGAGQIRAITASSIFLDSSAVIDGSLTAANNCFITIRNTTLSNVQIAGQVLVADNHNLNIPVAGIINNADIAVNNGGANGTFIRLTGGSATVTGTGTITLNASTNLDTSQITTNSGNWTCTSGPGQIIRGTGRIYTPLTNNGIIRADRAGAPLEWRNSGGTNNNLVTTGGGPLNIVSSTVTQGENGRIIAADGVLGIYSSTINGGSIEGTGSPVEIYNSTISASTLSGVVNVPNNFTFNLPITGITNNATIRIGDNAGAAGTFMRLISGIATINGNGTIILDANSNLDTAQLTSNSGNWLMNITSGQTIRGDGRIYARLTNSGTIIADQNGAALEWLNTGGNTNNSIARTANGGVLRISSLGLTQSPTGRLIASDGPVIISGSTVVGGSIEGTNSQAQIVNSTLDGLTTTGDVRIPNGSTLSTSSNGIANDGAIRVSDGVGAAATFIRMTNGSHTFSGTGSIILNANSNLDTAQLTSNSGNWTMTLGPNQALRGTGRVYARTVINGTLSPGEPEFTAGRISFINVSPVLTSSANAVFDIFGPTNFDQVEGNAAWTIQGGTITIRFPGGFVGALGQSYTLISGGSITGVHATRQLPAHPTQGLKYGLDYRSNAVILRVTCNIDFNSDGVVDLFDYLDFVQIFQTGELDADYNGDGITDFFDYLDFVAEFANGCN